VIPPANVIVPPSPVPVAVAVAVTPAVTPTTTPTPTPTPTPMPTPTPTTTTTTTTPPPPPPPPPTLTPPLKPSNASRPEDEGGSDSGKLVLPLLSESLYLDSLWETLSACLLELEHTSDHHAVLVLQPAVEAFFLLHSSSSTSRERSSESGTENLDVVAEIAPVSPIYSDNEGAAQSDAAAVAATPTAAAAGNNPPTVAMAASAGAALVPVANNPAVLPHTWDVNATAVQKVLPPDQLKFLKFAGKCTHSLFCFFFSPFFFIYTSLPLECYPPPSSLNPLEIHPQFTLHTIYHWLNWIGFRNPPNRSQSNSAANDDSSSGRAIFRLGRSHEGSRLRREAKVL
jgi:hypothetical protein